MYQLSLLVEGVWVDEAVLKGKTAKDKGGKEFTQGRRSVAKDLDKKHKSGTWRLRAAG
mgnify:CR=1 FL=1